MRKLKIVYNLAARVWLVSKTPGVVDRSAQFGEVFVVFIKNYKNGQLKSQTGGFLHILGVVMEPCGHKVFLNVRIIIQRKKLCSNHYY